MTNMGRVVEGLSIVWAVKNRGLVLGEQFILL
jgi:hypothetical protein